MKNYTVVIITQIIEHKSADRQHILESEQFQIGTESVHRARDIAEGISKRTKEFDIQSPRF